MWKWAMSPGRWDLLLLLAGLWFRETRTGNRRWRQKKRLQSPRWWDSGESQFHYSFIHSRGDINRLSKTVYVLGAKSGEGDRESVCFGVMWELVLHRMAREGLSLTKGDGEPCTWIVSQTPSQQGLDEGGLAVASTITQR